MRTCQWAKSDMTPCVLKDGPVAFAMNSRDEPICVGCERHYTVLGLERPPNWDAEVAAYKKSHEPTRARGKPKP